MASDPSDSGNPGPIHDACEHIAELKRLEARYARLLELWKNEQRQRLSLEEQLKHAREWAQQLRAIL